VLGVSAPPTARGRVALRPLTLPTAQAILARRRQPDWSSGYPGDGDRDIAKWLTGHPPTEASDPLYLPREIIDLTSGLVVGSIGCHRPPDDEMAVEIGYGIAPEVRNQGLTSEAARLLLAELVMGGVQLVTARTRPDNPPSHAVLRHNGFETVGSDADGFLVWHLRLESPG
jgi:[ribosomal protein S5]-alanine N-acetyltransferase